MIFSKLAPELFPSIRPSVEYLAEEVPVPIPSADSEYDKFMCCDVSDFVVAVVIVEAALFNQPVCFKIHLQLKFLSRTLVIV